MTSSTYKQDVSSKVRSDPTLKLIDEVANMDVDNLPAYSVEGAASSSTGHLASIVLDTNVLLSHLEVIQQFADDIERSGEPVSIVIPGVVVQELDYQKEDRSRHLCWSARMASTWILSKLRERKSVRGQAYQETLQQSGSWKRRDKDTSNDELIVDCCLYLQKVKKHLVLAISQDHNFSNAAESQGLPTLNPRDYQRWSSRSLAAAIFGPDYPRIHAFSDYRASFRPKRVRDALNEDLGVAKPKFKMKNHMLDADGMDIDEDIYSSQEPPPQHLLDHLHEEVLVHFEILLKDLLRRVAPPSLFAQPPYSAGSRSSIHASPLSSKPAIKWDASDILEYLCDRRRMPRDASPRDVAALQAESARMRTFFSRKYQGGRSGQHWARADWVACLSQLGLVSRVYGDSAIANSLLQLEPQFELVFSMPMRPTGTGYFGI